ncbi:MAG: GNAT family N-acetyltransferase [bacterium]
MNDSKDFKEHYRNNTFKKRIKVFEDIEDDNIYIEIIKYNSERIGYCISTVKAQIGEIDSLFLDEEYRGNDLGKTLVINALEWLEKKGAKEIKVAVAAGHEHVFDFYDKFGFKPSVTYLKLK